MDKIREVRAQTMVELKSKIYAKHGMTRIPGESQTKFLNQYYDIKVDYARNHYVATLKPKPEGTK